MVVIVFYCFYVYIYLKNFYERLGKRVNGSDVKK